MNKTIQILVIAVAIVLAGFVIGVIVDKDEFPVGSAGPDYYNTQYFWGGLIDGGEVITLTTATTTSITAKQVCESSVINWLSDNTSGAATTTLPGAADMNTQCLMVNGASKTFLFRNTAASGSTTQFVVASTTSDTLLFPEGQDTLLEGANSALITFLRTAATTIVVNVTELVDAGD